MTDPIPAIAKREVLVAALHEDIAESKPSVVLRNKGHEIDERLFSVFEGMYLLAKLDIQENNRAPITAETLESCVKGMKLLFEDLGLGEFVGDELIKGYDSAVKSALDKRLGRSPAG